MTDRELMDKAREASGMAYVPYSQFPVGAAIECSDGTVFTGCNVENAALGSTICAERTAACKMCIRDSHYTTKTGQPPVMLGAGRFF